MKIFFLTLIVSLFALTPSLAREKDKSEIGQLYGIVMLKPDAICFNENKMPWACGELATKTLKSLIAQNGVKCTKMASTTDENSLLCQGKKFVVNSVLVGLGLAIPTTEGSHYDANQLRAQKELRGVWRFGKDWVEENRKRLFSARVVAAPQA